MCYVRVMISPMESVQVVMRVLVSCWWMADAKNDH